MAATVEGHQGGRRGQVGITIEDAAAGVRDNTGERGRADNDDGQYSSSDDSNNSEYEDRRAAESTVVTGATRRHGTKTRRRAWRPLTERTEWTQREEDTATAAIRTHESFIGDSGQHEERCADRELRIATTNINKGMWGKVDRELRTWFQAHKLDFLMLADTGTGEDATKVIWGQTAAGTPAPGMLVIASARAAIMMDQARWESRWKKDDTRRSPSGRSIGIVMRLGQRQELLLIATYMPHSPQEQRVETRQEREWVAQAVGAATAKGSMVVVAGDFNAYASEATDRESTGVRQAAARRESVMFANWMDQIEVRSTFRVRHPVTQRHTYARAGTRVALDDIMISETHANQVSASGVWLSSIQASDHVGTPFATLRLNVEQHSRRQLVGVKAIKRVVTKARTQEELAMFTQEVDRRLAAAEIQLIPLLSLEEPVEEGHTRDWLERAINNMYECMYSTAKQLWGESSQTKRDIDRNVSIQRTTRCHGQWKAVQRLARNPAATAQLITEAVRTLQWPKWVRHPDLIPAGSPHAARVDHLVHWIHVEYAQDRSRAAAVQWQEEGWRRWKRVLRIRRDWRTRQRWQAQEIQRGEWMQSGQMRKLLHATLGRPQPPVTIQGALVGDGEEQVYIETREAVERSMSELLDAWVPVEQRTQPPIHLTTGADEDVAALPQFVREWLLPDIAAGGTCRVAFNEPGKTWEEFSYDADMQTRVDRKVSKGVSPGYGGVAQELWVAAPAAIRERERQVFTAIIKTGTTPAILNHRQMIFLPKSATATGVWDRQGLPPWRPITVQSALATRLFTAISGYLEERAPNHPMQHGFQKDRNVQDAALATTLLLDRAKRKKEELYLLSKDCEKCYDRIPKWVMDYIYRALGVPVTLRHILMSFLAASEIDVRTAYGWVSTGTREFGLGQGSVLSIRHIGYYMDKLMERQTMGTGGVSVNHGQEHGPCTINSTVLVDDVVDVATTRAGIEDRAAVSNVFTGIHGTGGVFGATKSFLLHYVPRGTSQAGPVQLNDGLGEPRDVRMVSPAEGFRHLGVVQSTADVWSATIRGVWAQLRADAIAVGKVRIAPAQFRYIVNHVWLPRLMYRTQLGFTLKTARHIDTLIRRTARQVLRVPHSMPTAWYTDATQGLGLHSCVDACNSSRVQLALRVLNTPHIPAHHLLQEALEAYQTAAGLTDHPLADPLPPPSHMQSWVHQTIRAAAHLGVKTVAQWRCPEAARSLRPNDRSLWRDLVPSEMDLLLKYNLRYDEKLRHVGDVADATGTLIKDTITTARHNQWSTERTLAYTAVMIGIHRAHCLPATLKLREPVGRTRHDARRLLMPTVEIGPGQFFVVSQFVIGDNGPEMRGYELGQRVGDTVHQNEQGHGLEINVQWWHERQPRTDVWTERPDARATEYAEICVPVEVTPVTRGRGRPRVIIWTDTRVHDIMGTEDRERINTSFQRSFQRWHAVVEDGLLTEARRECQDCGRRQGSQECGSCARWHHAECRQCPAPETLPFGAAWAVRSQTHTTPRTTNAGDGSVRAGGTVAAHGGWGLQSGDTEERGELHVHWRDVTSTRMECHALLAGLAASNDSGTQICDNQAAIRILRTARAKARGEQPKYTAHTNRHRVEIRSMCALMRPGGTFEAIWVRSHQEHTITQDETLTAQRAALARADALAADNYGWQHHGTYATLLKWDHIHLVDDRGRPVLGATRVVLEAAAATARKLAWIQKQREQGQHRETACTTSVNTCDLVQWTTTQRRFYWMTIAHALHTSAKKHRLHAEWDPRCRCCSTGNADTQEHRFGVADDRCAAVGKLDEHRSTAIETVCATLMLPDQEHLLPGRAEQLARASNHPTRPLWSACGVGPEPRVALIELQPSQWVHSIQLEHVITAANYERYACALFAAEKDQSRRAPAGRILPRAIQAAAHKCSPGASQIGYFPSQLCGLWATGSLSTSLPHHAPALKIGYPPDTCTDWWIDDLVVPMHDCAMIRDKIATARSTWVACYADTPLHAASTAIGFDWLISIPAGELLMRTTRSTFQTVPTTRANIHAKNPRVVHIGVFAPDATYAQHHEWRQDWAETLQHGYSLTWLNQCATESPPAGRGPRQAIISWAPAPDGLTLDPTAAVDRAWLRARHPGVYGGPAGWQSFPSANADLTAWARDLSNTHAESKAWVVQILRVHWDALRRHWNETCATTIASVGETGDLEQHATINQAIRDGRRAWHAQDYHLDTAIAAHTLQLHDRSAAWRANRIAHE